MEKTAAKSCRDRPQYVKSSDDEDETLQARHTYPSGDETGPDEAIIKRLCVVTNVWPLMNGFELSVVEHDPPLPLVGMARTRIRTGPLPDPPPQTGDFFTVVFRRGLGMDDTVPWTLKTIPPLPGDQR